VQTAAGYAAGTGWNEAADRLGFALLAPEQTNANNIGGCFNWFQPGDVAREGGEAASIRQMIARMIADHGLDARRIYVTGLSAGGAMAAALLAAYPEIFAGGAVIAGLPYGAASNVPEALNAMRRAPEHANSDWAARVRSASDHKGPWPVVSIWHGDADATVHVSNAEALTGQWTALHRVSTQSPEIEDGPGYARRSWRGADGRTVLESWSVAGLAHGVPIHAGNDKDSFGQAGPYFIEAGLSSTLKIAAFWGLARPSSHVAPHLVAKTDAPARAMPPPPTVPPPVPLASAYGHKPVREIGGVQGVIRKALQAAGLVKKL
jgi:poly(hydroxyalkanoate) depolymerase family esterase